MKPGSVIVDMAAEQGGNCELTEPGQACRQARRHHHRLHRSAQPSGQQSSTLYANNLLRLTEELCKTKDGQINVNMEDDALRGLTVIKDGSITWPPPPPKPAAARRGGETRRRAAPAAKKGHGHGGSSEPMSAQQMAVMFGIAAALFWLIGANAPAAFLGHFTVFVLACFVGYMVVWNVKPALHTPLMSVTNAVSSIIAIGALVQIAPPLAGDVARPDEWIRWLGDWRHRSRHHQHVRRLRRHPAHAGNVPQVRRYHPCLQAWLLSPISEQPFFSSSAWAVFPIRKRSRAATSTA
jgi:H+-translocating NAD(P) transhydrogenase subunit alpha